MKRIIVIFFIALSVVVQAQPTISNNGMFYSFAENGLLNGLIAAWGFDETTAFDSHGVYDGTNSGATVGQTGIINNSYLFADVGDHIDMGNESAFNLNQSGESSSISTWVYSTANQTQHVVSKDLEYALTIRQGTSTPYIRFDMFGANSGTAAEITLNTWHHILVAWEAGVGGTIYLDGSVYKSFSTTDISSPSIYNLWIGLFVGANTEQFLGYIDQTLIYNRELSLADAELLSTAIPYSQFTARLEQSIKMIYNRFYENIIDVEIPLRVAA